MFVSVKLYGSELSDCQIAPNSQRCDLPQDDREGIERHNSSGTTKREHETSLKGQSQV